MTASISELGHGQCPDVFQSVWAVPLWRPVSPVHDDPCHFWGQQGLPVAFGFRLSLLLSLLHLFIGISVARAVLPAVWIRFCWLGVSSCWVNVWTICSNRAVFRSLNFSWASRLDAWEPWILVHFLFTYFWSGLFIVNSVMFSSCGSGSCHCSLLKYPGRKSLMTLSQMMISSWWLKELALLGHVDCLLALTVQLTDAHNCFLLGVGCDWVGKLANKHSLLANTVSESTWCIGNSKRQKWNDDFKFLSEWKKKKKPKKKIINGNK